MRGLQAGFFSCSQRQRKRLLKINILGMVTILRLLLLPRIFYC